jgi:hypothetical protein
MSKASDEALGELHGAVASVLSEQLRERVNMTDEDTGESKEVYLASPAVLAQAIKFLKDNDITASIADDENLSELDDLLKRKREKRGLRLTTVGGEAV